MKAAALRRRFRSIPRETRREREANAIRIWRGISWLKRAELFPDADTEGRFIGAWIAFNALYGCLGVDGRALPDRESWNDYLVRVFQRDLSGSVGRTIHHHAETNAPLAGKHNLETP